METMVDMKPVKLNLEPREAQPSLTNPDQFVTSNAVTSEATHEEQEEGSVEPYEPELRDETSDQWSDEVHRQLGAWSALESEVQDRANTEHLAVVRRNIARYREAFVKETQKRKEKRRKLKADMESMRQSWSMRRTTTSAVASHPSASSSTDPHP